MGRELGLGDGWPNDDVRTHARVEIAPDARARVLYDSPHLAVTQAPETHLPAMRVRALQGRLRAGAVEPGEFSSIVHGNRLGHRDFAG